MLTSSGRAGVQRGVVTLARSHRGHGLWAILHISGELDGERCMHAPDDRLLVAGRLDCTPEAHKTQHGMRRLEVTISIPYSRTKVILVMALFIS